MTKVSIVGAGMSGLLAAALLRNEADYIYEAQPELPNNHSAVLRFRSSIVGDAIGCEFKKVDVIKAVAAWRNPIADAMSYSLKNGGTATMRSIASARGEIVTRYVAPLDLIERMANASTCAIHFADQYDFASHSKAAHSPVISTIPMPALASALGYEFPRGVFYGKTRGSINIRVLLRDVDAYCSLYVPDPAIPFSRASLTGNELILECPDSPEAEIEHWEGEMALSIIEQGMELMGLPTLCLQTYHVSRSLYAKLLPIPESHRRHFITWASQEHNIYSLGRFATWRPSLLMDDCVNDVRVIRRLIGKDHDVERYNHH